MASQLLAPNNEGMRLLHASSAGLFASLLFAAPVSAGTTIESATLGETGQTDGFLVSTLWVGVRFELTEDTTVTSLGAHIADGSPPGTVFLALFEVDDASSYPSCGTTECAVHTELFEPPSVSDDVVLPVEVPVTAGHYIVVAGTFSAGAQGLAWLPLTNTPVGGTDFVRRYGSNGVYYWDEDIAGLSAEQTRLTVTYAACGDGEVDVGEACDDGNADDTDACLTGCISPSCGDGFVQAGVEACDDGNESDDDECANDCTLVAIGSSSGGDGSSAGSTSSDASSSGAGETGDTTSGGTTSGGPATTSAGSSGDNASAGGTMTGGTSTTIGGGASEGGTESDTDGGSSASGAAGCSSGAGEGGLGWLLLLMPALFRRRR